MVTSACALAYERAHLVCVVCAYVRRVCVCVAAGGAPVQASRKLQQLTATYRDVLVFLQHFCIIRLLFYPAFCF